MNEEYTTTATERLADESTCGCCKKPVKEWLVTFEQSIHADSGFDKRHRCPHCGARSFADVSESAAIFLFFIAFYPSALVWGVLISRLNHAFQWRYSENASAILLLIASGITGWCFSSLICRIWKAIRIHSWK